MATLKETAKEYTPKQTRNIAELDKVDVNIDIKTREFTKEDGESFTVNVIVVDGEEYRVPNQVIQQLHGLLEKFPDTQYFSVTKTGEGLKTQYQVFSA